MINKNRKQKNQGTVLIIIMFIIALASAVIAGMMQINTERIQLMRNQVFAAQATAIAEAGLADAFAEIRSDATWNNGFSNKSFGNGSYAVTVSGGTVTSTGTSAQGFKTRIAADITIGSSSPYIIRIDKLRINQ